MSPLKLTTFRLETELMDAMQAIRRREGIPVSEQVRRGILLWLRSKSVRRANPSLPIDFADSVSAPVRTPPTPKDARPERPRANKARTRKRPAVERAGKKR